jgi:mono/diheme cytochrome c family protein
MLKLRRVLVAVCIALAIGALVVALNGESSKADAPVARAAYDAAEIARGKYIADAGNCMSCHTVAGKPPFSGGVRFETPFGVLYSSNITPDATTGIGGWSLEDLRRAMHEGVSADGSALFPAFPYTAYTKVSDVDIASLYAYLRSLPPVRSEPPRNDFLLRQRWALPVWKALYFEDGRYTPDAAQSAEWNRGAYLVEGLGHCSACHSPRNRFMAEEAERAYEGGELMHEVADGKVRLWSAINLTQAKSGLAKWSVNDLAKYLHTGFSLRAGTFGPMNEVIVNSLSKLSAEDARAMAVYLKSLPAREYAGPGVTPEQAQAGADIYEERCEKCHGASGRGGMFSGPPLAGSAVAQHHNPASLLNNIIYGPDMPKEVSFGGWETMKAYGDVLDDEEIAAVSNYIRGSWGNSAPPVSAEDVARQR